MQRQQRGHRTRQAEAVIARDVIILGAGPAGLAAAAELKRLGLRDITIIDREAEAGGIPRHCGHLGFGFREFHRLLTGPQYARAIAEAAGAISLGVTALRLEPGGLIQATGPHGGEVYRGKAVLLAMGARETPRRARLVSGTRPWGVMTTGALQQFVYLHGKRPFERPVVIGTELVSFSTLMTLRHVGIKPAAMIEANDRITARRPGDLVARAVFGAPILLSTQLARILGKDHVEGVEIDRGKGAERLDCDGVIFTGKFRPESALLANGPVAIDYGTLGPAIDQYWRCSDPAFFAAGNLLRGIETAGQCWREGRAAARAIAAALDGKLPGPIAIPVHIQGALQYVYPQRIAPGDALDSTQLFKARASKAATGTLTVRADDKLVWSRKLSTLPERRIAWPVAASPLQGESRIKVALEEA
jgi:NADPH-dependent 2,4-dienoyl-CoA reductase/sulfur reductase-like enzyme